MISNCPVILQLQGKLHLTQMDNMKIKLKAILKFLHIQGNNLTKKLDWLKVIAQKHKRIIDI